MSNDASEDFLYGSGGNYADFAALGTFHGGFIAAAPTVSQQTDMTTGELKTWPNGDPMKQLIVTLQTDERDPANPDDTGLRTLYVKGSMKPESESMTAAIAGAVKAAGGARLEVGGWLGVQYYADGVPTTKGFSPPKKYRAQYRLPTVQEQFLGTVAPAAALPPAPVQQAMPMPPAAQPGVPAFLPPGAIGAPAGQPLPVAPMPAAPGIAGTDPWSGQPVAQAAPAGWPAVPGALPAAPVAPAAMAPPLAPPVAPVAPPQASPVDQVRAMIQAQMDVPTIMGSLQLTPADMATCLLTIGYDVPTVAGQLNLPSTTVQLIANMVPAGA